MIEVEPKSKNFYKFNTKVSCKQCNTEFYKNNREISRSLNNFCSQSCSATYNNTNGIRIRKIDYLIETEKAMLIEKFKECKSTRNLLMTLGVCIESYSFKRIKDIIQQWNIDVSHWKPRTYNKSNEIRINTIQNYTGFCNCIECNKEVKRTKRQAEEYKANIKVGPFCCQICKRKYELKNNPKIQCSMCKKDIFGRITERSKNKYNFCSLECRREAEEKRLFISKKDLHEYTNSGSSFRKRLFEIRGKQCEKCKRMEWEGSPIPLEVHHVDGNSKNNSEENVQVLCCNCHALTPNWKAKNSKYYKENILPKLISPLRFELRTKS